MLGLEGRVVVVTGAGRGIGASVARALGREGARVIVNDLGTAMDGTGADAGPASEIADQIRAAGGEASVNHDNVADFDGAGSIIDQAVSEFGRLDVLINVAGILRDGMIFKMSPENWRAVIDVHLNGTFNTTRHAAAYWREQRDPGGNFRLINFTSGSGLHGAPGQPNYAAAKLGIVGLTYSCANALGRYGVTANAVAPQAMTRMMDNIPNPEERIPRHIIESGNPDNVVPVVAYLASDRSSWCTGQVLAARGLDIGLYSKPEVIRLITSPVPWDLETAFGLIERVIRPAIAGEPPAAPDS
jgi:NAD(P)-dependent dehydrogenase (short-subunit alcohol dehydrogenase family)